MILPKGHAWVRRPGLEGLAEAIIENAIAAGDTQAVEVWRTWLEDKAAMRATFRDGAGIRAARPGYMDPGDNVGFLSAESVRRRKAGKKGKG